MSTQTDRAQAAFHDLLGSARDMVDLGVERRTDAGRRREEMPLNRGAVVLAIAAWQTYAEETARGILDALGTGPASPLFRLIRADTLSAIGRFNTPNSSNTLDLFARVGFDPSPRWGVTIRWAFAHHSAGGTLDKTKTFAPTEARFELDAWLQVRHRIAHGRNFDPADALLKSVLSGRSTAGLTLWRADAERCIAFVRALADATAAEAAVQFP